MSFVHPGYLWFLSLLAIPIILHLFHFRRFKRYYFPSLKFLKEQEQEKKSVKKLRRLLILITRILALTALIFAFAQPYFKKSAIRKNGIPITAIYIDNSLSMSAKGTEGELLSEAREIARSIITKSAGNTRFFIVTNGFFGLERKLHSKATALEVIDKITFNKSPRMLEQVLKWQYEYIYRYHREIGSVSRVNSVFISDFQKSTGNLASFKHEQTPWSEHTYVIQCLPQNSENIFVDSVWMEYPVHRPGQSCKLNFKVKNVGNEDVTDIPVSIQFDGKTRMTNLSINAQNSTTSHMFFTPITPGYIDGKVSVSDRNITFDDDFYFTNELKSKGNVVLVNGESSESSTSKVFSTEPFYQLESYSEFSFNKRHLNQADLLILNGLNELPSGLISDVTAFISSGGSVFCIPGSSINLADYKLFLNSIGLEGFNGKVTTGNQLSEIAYSSIFFKGMFERQETALNLPLFKSVLALKNSKQANAEILLKLRNQLPLMLAVKQKGTCYLLTAELSKANGGFTSNALFPSILLRSAELSLRSFPSYFTIGSAGVLEIPSNANQDEPLTLNSNTESFIPNQMISEGMIRLQLNQPELNERITEGIYTVNSSQVLGKVAFNLNRSESNTVLNSRDAIKVQFEQAGFLNVTIQRMQEGNSSFNFSMEKPSSFWRIFVLLTFLFLLVEMAILKFWK